MRLHKVNIKNFRKIKDCEIFFEDATFLIGSNNSGKSSVFAALEYLHGNKNLQRDDYSKFVKVKGEEVQVDDQSESPDETIGDEEIKEKVESDGFQYEDKVEIIAEYHNIPEEAKDWLGFKGRVILNDKAKAGESPYKIVYKKVWDIKLSKPNVFLKEYNIYPKEKYKDATTVQDLIGDDFSEELLKDMFGEKKLKSKLSLKDISATLKGLSDYWEVNEQSDADWVENPGGIPGNVLSKLPRVVIIPAESCLSELESKSGSLHLLMTELFAAVRKKSINYQQAQTLLNALAKEMDPSDANTDFGKLMRDLNGMVKSVFPESSVHVGASLEDAEKVIQPIFNVEMESNVKTPVKYQGHGMIRATAFQLYRFAHDFYNREALIPRSTIFCFEEPEIYLHPAAANQMRDALYSLAGATCQVVATTHSPYMVDLSTDKKMSLTKFSRLESGFTKTNAFNLTDAFKDIAGDEKLNLKMLLKVDDCVSRVFFTNKCIFVEGDTEEVVIRETIKRLTKNDRDSVIGNCEVIRARGKAVFISLAKYLNALDVNYIILHDEDSQKAGARIFNDLILNVSTAQRRIMIRDCIEDILNYPPPSSDKPYKAHKHISDNWTDFNSIPEAWRDVFKLLHSPYLDHI
ncbi:AAA family ATPase [Candidatus Pantoea floridensis]|uniref:Predicted ATP-dependent endonuclease of the OLD family, contains P-loop ATPase and TOPRIM domains n=1 Tax=Candidatus Pantoea floridensis TaxID=1938870 RepID=A0A286BVC4_9GAMM|nr:AAA family ATPase [Pantoea floridensis]PIF14002.1 putative ATP-dependent endonuclease of OLD family [Enterobacteriaceae bacterium JKS000233]SOD38101.1 Predicted ATP-dependent endonuclease of the OLD family, contains P-loop ATPase and TOPRIM domains [Pantoea floridensis]